MEKYFNFGVYRQDGNYKNFSFYGESGDTDFRVVISFTPEDGVTVEESLCGRDRASVWSETEEDYSSEGFWATVKAQADRFGGISEISPCRIGEKDYW